VGDEHQHPERRSQTNTEVQPGLAEIMLLIGQGGEKAATRSIALGACSLLDVLPQGFWALEKPSPSSSMKIHRGRVFHT